MTELERMQQAVSELYKKVAELERKTVYTYENHPFWLKRHARQIEELGTRITFLEAREKASRPVTIIRETVGVLGYNEYDQTLEENCGYCQ